MKDKAVFEAISFAAPMGVMQADVSGAVVEASRRMEVLFQAGSGGLLGAGWLASVHPMDQESVTGAWHAAVERREPFDQDFRVLPPGSAETGHVRMQASPAMWGEPPRPGFTAVAGDISVRKRVEEQLRSANRFLERAESLSGVGGWEADLRSREVKWTDQNCRIYDLEPGHQASLGEHLKYFAKEAQSEMVRAARRSMRTGVPWDLTLPMVTAAGRPIWVRSMGLAEFEDGHAVRLVGALQDITGQQASREALRESEERQKRAMDASRLALWDLDLESGLGYLSENWSELMGQGRGVTVTTARELIARVPKNDQLRIGTALTAMFKGTAPRYDVEHQVLRDDGSLIWIHSRGRVSQRDASGRALRATGTNHDITARKLAELELARAATITKATLDSTADGILVMSGEREILLFNRRLLEMMNIPDSVGVTRKVWGDIVISQLADSEGYVKRILALYEAPEKDSFDVLEFKDGRVFERYGRPLALSGSATGRVWSFRDVTARAQADAELKRAKEVAEAANRAKSDFLDTISHEIRTPLNGVLGMTRLLLEETLAPQQRRYVELANSSAQSLLALINDVLDLGKIESGRLEFEHVEFSMVELARELGDLYALRAKDKGLQFDMRLDPAVPAMVVGDPGRLRQVLENLLSNALKFTAAGLVGLDIHLAPPVEGRVMLGFTVHDTGIGIAPDVQEGLFQRFFQADSSTTREYGGTGLGLAIVKQLCEQMGGHISLNSEAGRGASFRCVLPFAPAAARAPSPTPAPRASRTKRATRPQRILVAEDNGTNQIVVKGMLSLFGYTDVTMVEDGQQALDAVQREHFDAILMDCRMPVMDGYEAAARLRAGGWRLPIIALTANVSEEQRKKCLAAGMDDFLSKPMEASQLADTLDRWTAAPSEAVFAEQKALDRMDGDVELFRQVLDSFIDLAPRVLEKIGAALERDEATEVHRHLHSLAGSAAMVSAEVLGKLARALEKQALEGHTTGLERGLVELHAAFDDFLHAAAATIKDRAP